MTYYVSSGTLNSTNSTPEFRNSGEVAKITGRAYSKSHAILVYYLVQQAKYDKIKDIKIT